MKLVVGLGNPGEKYKNNRHNVGFLVVDRLEKLKLPGVVLAKPQTFMNRSGGAVKKLLKKYPKVSGEDLYIIHDDLDIKLGEYKISWAKGPKDHNGLNSIYEQLGSREFWHVRVGIDNRHPGSPRETRSRSGESGEDYVLSDWRREEKARVEKTIKEVVNELKATKVLI